MVASRRAVLRHLPQVSALTALRFLLTGLANTALGLLVVIACAQGLGWSPYVSNATGYAAGLAFGFVLNRGWTFGDRRKLTVTAPRYVVAFAISYAANLLVLAAGLHALALPESIAQALALSTYSLVFFLLCRYFVFESRAG
jgi:putative flippase GtrA